MSKVVLCIAALAIVAVGPSQAWAQRQGRGGFGGGGFGGGAFLLGQKSVQDELKLSEDQVKQVTALSEKQRTSLGELRDLGQQERRAKVQEQARAADKEIAGILKPEQLTRFKEIALQQRGPSAFNDPEVVQALNLTADQKEKIREIQQSAQAERREAFQAGAGGDRAAARKKIEALNASTTEKIDGVLTSEQKEKFKTLTGASFKGEITRPQFRGGGGAARGARTGRGNADASVRHEHFSLASAAPPEGAAGVAGADEGVQEHRTAADNAAADGNSEAKPAAPAGPRRHGARGRGAHGPGPAFGGGPRHGRGPGFAPRGPGRPGQQFAGWHRHRHHRRHAGPAFAHHHGRQFAGGWGHHRHGGPRWGYAVHGYGQGRGWHGHPQGRHWHGYHHGHRQYAAAGGPHGFGPHAFGGHGMHAGPGRYGHHGPDFAGGPRGGHGGHHFAAYGPQGGHPHHMAGWRHHPHGRGGGHDHGERGHGPRGGNRGPSDERDDGR